ncbi:MAG: small, acid-soluble spore protein, alpha/beta type [Clostridia bacterium]|nr:small, acid-soluble spore protein, alpha/beta type [Clostridia bacterium]
MKGCKRNVKEQFSSSSGGAALDQFKMEAARDVGVQLPLKENIQHIANSIKHNQHNALKAVL